MVMNTLFKPGVQVQLLARTAKARQWIKLHGGIGRIREIRDQVAFSSDRGPWLLVEATDPDARWVHQSRDPNFTVGEVVQ